MESPLFLDVVLHITDWTAETIWLNHPKAKVYRSAITKTNVWSDKELGAFLTDRLWLIRVPKPRKELPMLTKTQKSVLANAAHKPAVIHATTKPAFYGQHWKSSANGKWYGHVKGMNHAIVFPSQAYKSPASFAKLMSSCGWTTTLITDPEFKTFPDKATNA